MLIQLLVLLSVALLPDEGFPGHATLCVPMEPIPTVSTVTLGPVCEIVGAPEPATAVRPAENLSDPPPPNRDKSRYRMPAEHGQGSTLNIKSTRAS